MATWMVSAESAGQKVGGRHRSRGGGCWGSNWTDMCRPCISARKGMCGLLLGYYIQY